MHSLHLHVGTTDKPGKTNDGAQTRGQAGANGILYIRFNLCGVKFSWITDLSNFHIFVSQMQGLSL